MSAGNARERWSRWLTVAGGVAMLVGAIDPLEGSVVVLPGSGLVTLGAYLSPGEVGELRYRWLVLVLVAIGVGALWGLWALGGESGPSPWWGLLILPYPIGWSLGIWGPGAPRWLLWPGIVIGLWYVALVGVIARAGDRSLVPVTVIGVVGLVTIVGCARRLRQGRRGQPGA